MKIFGLVKLMEECAELIQVAAKMAAYPELAFSRKGLHPDGSSLRTRMIEEIGDVYAAIGFVVDKLELSTIDIHKRMKMKRALFDQWDKEP